MFLERIASTIDRHGMLEPGETVLVAVSGGVDSVALLHALSRLAPRWSVDLHVAHVDHGWRGEASAADGRFVAAMAAGLGLPCTRSRIDDLETEPTTGLGREGAAREARRELLTRIADAVGATRIALGHTANDQAETVLHHLTRGAGGAGLRGMPAVSERFIRPMLDIRRADVLAYAGEHALTWREDASNANVRFSRNRIRHRVIPELERINARAVEAIVRSAELAADLEAAVAPLLDGIWKDLRSPRDDGTIALRRAGLLDLEPSLRRLVVRRAIRDARDDLEGIERVHIESVLSLLASDRAHGELSLPGLHVRMQNDDVSFLAKRPADAEAWSTPLDLGETRANDGRTPIHLSLVERAVAAYRPSSDRWSEAADADRLRLPLVLRSRRDGDRFTPLGLGREVKLKDFLINERVPYFERDDVALVCDRGGADDGAADGDRIVWVVGLRLSDQVRVTDTTRRILMMRAEVER